MNDVHRTSRRSFIGAVGALGTTAVVGASTTALATGDTSSSGQLDTSAARVDGAYGALGANFNGLLPNMDVPELQIGQVEWVRGFFPMPEADLGIPANNASIRAAMSAAARGYRTIFTLKFPYNQSAMPTPDSPEMETALAQVDKVLPELLDRVDILEIGNEPFIESRPEDRGEALNVFYETVTRHIIEYRRTHYGSGSRTRLYMGALNRLDLPDRQTAATERWMTFVRETPEIDGVDIHPHVPSADAVQPFLDYVLPRLRDDQTFLVTEFSLVWRWKAHMLDPIPAEFADRYGFSRDVLVWEVVRQATLTPFPQEQWNSFLSTSPWYESQKSFLRDQVKKFRATGRLAVATYTYRQGMPMSQEYTADKPPWVLNCVFASYTVRRGRDGTTGRGYPWLDEFQALQH